MNQFLLVIEFLIRVFILFFFYSCCISHYSHIRFPICIYGSRFGNSKGFEIQSQQLLYSNLLLLFLFVWIHMETLICFLNRWKTKAFKCRQISLVLSSSSSSSCLSRWFRTPCWTGYTMVTCSISIHFNAVTAGCMPKNLNHAPSWPPEVNESN